MLARAERLGLLLENALICLLLSALILLAGAQIVLRNFFSMGFTWADGLVRLMVLWLAMLGAVAASREGRHIAIDLAGRFLPRGLARIIACATCTFAALVSGALAWYSWSFVEDSREFGDRLLNDLPAWPFQAILPIGFALIAYRYALRAVARLARDGR